MCLILTVQLAEADSSRTAAILQAAGLPQAPGRRRSRLAGTLSGSFPIPGPEGGCGCAFLAESADWNAPSWDMIPAAIPGLVATLKAIHQHTTRDYTFEALWVGDQSSGQCSTTFEELIQRVEQSSLGTTTRYHVQREPAF